MAYRITTECVACGTCQPECPAEAIRQGDPIFAIDAVKCTNCGTCAGACPTEAIVQE